ncbi:glycoside hydrolase N-terminal domain-containing protein [Paenarthrobacter sp. NPDC056912]|uniref:glycoside hydrolase family 95 protein n=1 Tax=Paenarthrobacter sp. NPDC056912 TaxID=3345965 RepID=UPI00366F5D74
MSNSAHSAPLSHQNLLWYTAPATEWQSQSLPIGNGFLGAGIHGGLASDHLVLNEQTLWTGGPGSSEGYNFGNWPQGRPDALETVRKQIERDGSMAPEAVAAALGNLAYSGPLAKMPGFGSYQVFGDLHFDVPDTDGATNYRRYLDLNAAVAGVEYTNAAGAAIRRSYFASNPANVIVCRFDADQTGQISFTTRFASPHSPRLSVAGNRITVTGALQDNGLKYQAQLHLETVGGKVESTGNGLNVTGADHAVMYISMGTNYAQSYPEYRGEDPHSKVSSAVERAAIAGYDALLAEHQRDYAALFDRVRLDLGGEVGGDASTDQLLADYDGDGGPQDRALEQLFFNYGRYLLISSSRPGGLPSNLQGIWNRSTNPPWDADWHTNINVQMNYWPAEITNLAETAEPLHSFVRNLVAPGETTAQNMFQTGGWTVNQNTNPYGFTGVHDWATSFWMPEANAWLAQHLYEAYDFNRDVNFLREHAYPVMKGAAEFWLKNLRIDPRDGTLVASPSYSPEQGDFTAGAAISQQIIGQLFRDTVSAAEMLGDAAFRDRVQASLAQLDPGLAAGSWGQVKEWKDEAALDAPDNTHRHVSQLYALHPGNGIEVLAHPELAAAADRTLTARGDAGYGWSKAWKINFRARLRDGDQAHHMLASQLKTTVMANLWNTHPPFQIDGNFGAASGIAEMLLQSHHGVVDILPALPAAWRTGSVSGLKARGNVEVAVAWVDGRATEIRLKALLGGRLAVRSSLLAAPFRIEDDDGGPSVGAAPNPDGTLSFEAAPGTTYVITAT